MKPTYVVKSIRESANIGRQDTNSDGTINKTGTVTIGAEDDSIGLQKSFQFSYVIDPAKDTLNGIAAKLQTAGQAKFTEVTA